MDKLYDFLVFLYNTSIMGFWHFCGVLMLTTVIVFGVAECLKSIFGGGMFNTHNHFHYYGEKENEKQ